MRTTLLALTLLVGCGGSEPAPAPKVEAPKPPPPPKKEAPKEFDAAKAFTTVCATCHGPGGKGDGPAGAALDPKPASFADAEFWTDDRTDEHLAKVIKEGGASVGKSPLMAPWGAQYDDEQIKKLVAHVKSFKPAE